MFSDVVTVISADDYCECCCECGSCVCWDCKHNTDAIYEEPDEQEPVSTVCPDCHGSGYDPLVGDGAQCTKCGGLGWIDNPG